MNPAHLHLLVNHLPIIGFLLALPILGLAWMRARNSDLALAAAVLLLLSGGGTAAAYLTGEEAEEQIENQAGVAESYISAHEDAAKGAIPAGILATLAGACLVFGAVRGGGAPIGVVPLAGATLAAAVATGTMAYIGSTGGKIMHPEARQGSAISVPATPEGGTSYEAADDDDRGRGRAEDSD